MSDIFSIESHLDQGHIWGLMRNGRYWRLRRNGRTKRWIKAPERFSIPVKAGIKAHTYLNEKSVIGLANPQDKPDFVITSGDPNTIGPKAQ